MQSKMHFFKQIISDLLCTKNAHAVRDHPFGEGGQFSLFLFYWSGYDGITKPKLGLVSYGNVLMQA